MTDKEFRRLKRSELIEIIYELQKRELEYQTTIEDLREKLDRQEQIISEAGSIAEATVGLSGIFAQAQAVADQYLREVRRIYAAAKEQEAALTPEAPEEAPLEPLPEEVQPEETPAPAEEEEAHGQEAQ